MSSPIVHRSIYDFPTVSCLERALALENCQFIEDGLVIAKWKLDKYDELTSVDYVNDSYAEAKRLQVLLSYETLLDNTRSDPEMDELVYAAMDLLDTPMASIGFMDLGKLCIKASRGMDNIKEVPRANTVASHAIQRRAECGVLVVPDIQKDSRFRDLDTLGGARFCAVAPIRSPEGSVLGVLSVCDTQPRPEGLTLREQTSLQELADCAMASILLR